MSSRLFGARMEEGSDVNAHVNSMIMLFEGLENLDFRMDADLKTDLILQSLPKLFKSFITNFHLNQISCSLVELNNKLTVAQRNASSSSKTKKPALVVSGKKKKSIKKGKEKVDEELKVKSSPMKRKQIVLEKGESISKGKCFHCSKNGHWKRNCPDFLKSIKESEGKEKAKGLHSSFFNVFGGSSLTWVFDTHV